MYSQHVTLSTFSLISLFITAAYLSKPICAKSAIKPPPPNRSIFGGWTTLLTRVFSRYYRTLEKQRQIDELEQQNLLRDRERYLLCALDNFTKCLRHDDKYDLRVFRLISLWFDNESSVSVTRYMKVCSVVADQSVAGADWHLPGGSVGPSARWAATSNVEVVQSIKA